MYDIDAWEAYPHLRWVYDKLELCQRLGYRCGLTDPPPGDWFVKPRTNLLGMALGAHRYTGGPILLDCFWMPYFTGIHFSVDYIRRNGEWIVREVLSCQYQNDRPYLWFRHDMTEGAPVPKILHDLPVNELNVEYMSNAEQDNVFEAHLRLGTNFDAAPPWMTHAYVVWSDEDTTEPYVENYDDCDGLLKVPRLGFRYK